MEPDIFRDSAVIGIEVPVGPLIFGIGRSFVIVPVIVDAHGEDVFTVDEVGRQVESYGHDAVFMQTERVAVQIEVAALADTFEFDENLAAASSCFFAGLCG